MTRALIKVGFLKSSFEKNEISIKLVASNRHRIESSLVALCTSQEKNLFKATMETGIEASRQ